MSGATILVVDDEPQIRRTLRATLANMGYIVIEARSGLHVRVQFLHRTPVLVDEPDLGVLEGLVKVIVEASGFAPQ
jgi:CheY-like chemotaxis protein